MVRLAHNIRIALNYLRRHPVVSIVVILSVSIGVGLNVAIFSLVEDLLLRPFPTVEQPDELMVVYSRDSGQSRNLPVSYPNYLDLKEGSRTFSQMAAFQVTEVGVVIGEGAEKLYAEMVTAGFFEVLRLEPATGRFFLPSEDEVPGRDAAIVLSHWLWQERFDGDPAILGRSLLVNGQPFSVVGVAPAGFRGTNKVLSSALWVPTMMYREIFTFAEYFELRSGRVLGVLGRLEPDATISQVNAELGTIGSRLERAYPGDNEDQVLVAVPFNQTAIPQDRRSLFVKAGWLLTILVGLLLVLACVNVANLLSARSLLREQEISVRLSLGASRGQLFSQLLSESLLLGVLAGGFGMLVAMGIRRLLWAYRPPYLARNAGDFFLDWPVLSFTLVVTMLAVLLFGLIPALQGSRTDLMSALRQERRRGLRIRGLRLRSSSVLLQVALCLICLACAGFFLGSLQGFQEIDPGFDADKVLVASFDLQTQGYEEARAQSFRERLTAEVEALPGVKSVAIAENRLLGGWRWWTMVRPIGQDLGEQEAVRAGSSAVTPDYFDTVGIPIKAGRAISGQDRPTSRVVVVLNEELANTLWPDGQAVGQEVRLDDQSEPALVVGVVPTTTYRSLGEAPQPFLFVPMSQRPTLRGALHVRADRPQALLKPVQGVIRELDPQLPISDLQPASEYLSRSLWAPRGAAVLLSVLGGIALLLAGIGVYGVTAFSVARRRYEVGLRMALGADRSRVVGLLLREGMLVIAVGLLIGAGASFLLGRWIQSLLHEGGGGGLVVAMAIATLTLSIVAFFAILVPALRVAQANPATALRSRQ